MKVYNFVMSECGKFQSDDHKKFIESLRKNPNKWLEILEKERKYGNTYVLKYYPK